LIGAVFFAAFFAGTAFFGATVFFAVRALAATLGFEALRAGAFAVATFGRDLAGLVFNARVLADFAGDRLAVVRAVERLRPFARVLI
jgi:hypothetical protein